jgi:hypothetical protein
MQIGRITSLLYKSTLGIGDEVVHMGCEAGGHHFVHELGNCMYETNGAEFEDVLGSIFLWNEGNICKV